MKNVFTYKFLILVIICQFSYVLGAQNKQDTVYYNLKQLLDLARQNNNDLKLLQLELQKTEREVAIKKSNFLPKVDAFADYYWYWNNVPKYIFPESEGNILSGGTSNGPYPVSVGLPNNLFAGVSLTQRIFQFSYLGAGKSQEVLGKLESSRRKEKEEQVFYDIAVCYYEILKLAVKKNFIDFNLKRIDRFTGIVQVQLKDQMTDSLQLLDLTLTKADLLLSEDEFKSGIKRKTNYLKMLVGLPDSTAIDYSGLDYYPLLDTIRNQSYSENSTQLSLINNAQMLNELSQKQTQSEYLPTLDLRLNLLWNAQSQSLDFLSNPSYNNQLSTVGFKLDIPIYHGAEKKNKLQKLEIDNQILEVQKQKLAEGYKLQYSNALEELKFKTARYHHQQEITRLKKRLFEKASNLFDKGIQPIKELLTAQAALLEAQMKEAEALFDVKLAELNYFKWSNQILSRFE
jgi:outer membrane protein